MPTNKDRLTALSMVPRTAREVRDQIDGVKPKSAKALIGLDMAPPLANELAAQMVSGSGNAKKLSEVGMVPLLAKEVAAQIGTVPVLPPGNALARASTATYLNNAGLQTLAAIDAARFDYDPNTLAYRGLLLEKASTNYAPQSGNNLSTWVVSGGGTGAVTNPATLTATATTTAPDGSNADPGQGVAPCGMAIDTLRNLIILANLGQNKDGNPPTSNGIIAPSFITLNPTTLAKVSEFIIPAPYEAGAMQAPVYDPVTDLYGFSVPSSQFIRFYSPVTGLYVSSLAIPAAIVAPNGLTYDTARGLFWATSNSTGMLYAFNRTGTVVRTFAPTNNSSLIPDQLFYYAAADEIWFSVDDNTNGGAVYRLSCALDRIVGGGRCAAAKAIEGIAIVGSNVIIGSDGYFHSFPPQNVPAPFNVNVLLTYDLAGFVSFQYNRTFLDYGSPGILRLILNKGAGTTSSDFSYLGIAASYASGSTATKTLSFEARTRNPSETCTIFSRGDATAANAVITGTWAPVTVTASMVSTAQIQIGLRQGGAPYNTSAFCDILIRGVQMEPGSVATSFIPTTTAAVTRAEDFLTLPGVTGNYRVAFDDASTQTLALTASGSNVTVAGSALNRPRIRPPVTYLP